MAMTYIFESRATNTITMLESAGRHILQILGKDADAREGILLPAAIPAAIAALRCAVTAEESRAAEHRAAAAHDDPARRDADTVTLRQRAAPFIAMLERSMVEERVVVWRT